MSAKNILRFSRAASVRDRVDLAFLPAALEIVETPASPTGQTLVYAIIILFISVLTWTGFGHIDIVASATGKIVPSGGAKLIQPFETGVVRAIHVRDGQSVKSGEVLIELDPTINEAETGHIQTDLVSAELDVARLDAALAGNSDPVSDFHPPYSASPELRSMQLQLLIHQTEEQRAKLTALDRQKAQKQAELATVNATVKKLETVLPILQERVDIRQLLFAHETGSKVNYLEILQALVESQEDLNVQKSRREEAQSAVEALSEAKLQTTAEYQRTLYTQLVEAERRAAGLKDDLLKAKQRSQLQLLTAPVGGTVQQLAVHTIGGVVTAAQVLMVVVPAESHLEIEAMLSNRDIGFVHAGQDAEIKVDTFNFTKYGLLHGMVSSVSQDAVVREKPAAKWNDKINGSQDSSSEPNGQELNYSARVSLDRTEMNVDGQTVNLSPGMAVTVEVKTGTRRIISYLLSPLLRYKQNSLRER
jgi:hemolysin D